MPYDATDFVATDAPAPLNADAAAELFYAQNGPSLRGISADNAANVLDHYLSTGEINWAAAEMAPADTQHP